MEQEVPNNFLIDKNEKLTKILDEMSVNNISIKDLNIKKGLLLKKNNPRKVIPESPDSIDENYEV